MRGYEVRVHRGSSPLPELHWIVAASDEAAAERAEQLFVQSLDAIGVEVVRAGERLHVRGVVPVAAAPLSQRSESEPRSRLWALMQRIERCRHRAELAEAKTAKGSAAFRAEMAEIAQQWRDLAEQIEAENTPQAVAAAPPGRVGGPRRWPGVVGGVAVGALGALSLAAPRWIEASTGIDLDRGSGALEWAVALIAPLAAIAAAFAARTAPAPGARDRGPS